VHATDFKPWSEADDFARLEAVNANNQHPYSIAPDQLKNLLLRFYKHEDGKDPAPYFTEDEATRMSKQLAAQLSHAHAGDDVLFGSSWRPGLFLLTLRQLNAGRIFIDNGQLNLLVGTCNDGQDVSYFEAHAKVKPLNYGSRIKPVSNLNCELIAGNGAERVENRPDWLRVSLNTSAAPSFFPQATQQPTPAPIAAPVVQAPAPVAPRAPVAAAPAPTMPEPPASKAEQRLMMLKRLHDSGLITDEEYKEKRASAVKDL
jgi:hypothetical protein